MSLDRSEVRHARARPDAVPPVNRVSLVIPARDEAATIGSIVRRVRRELVDTGLVDEVVVMDSDSIDETAERARAAGAQVVAVREVRPELPRQTGKGEAIWSSLFVTSGDILVFLDGDLLDWGTHFVIDVARPLLTRPEVQLVKGYYDRVDRTGTTQTHDGGRVTELVARPLLSLRWPALGCVVQPLAGEWAIRRSVLETLSVPVGYGVELAVLVDVYERFGLDAIEQVDLGGRAHTHQSLHELGAMALELITVADRRTGLWADAPESHVLQQFAVHTDGGTRTVEARPRTVNLAERPPAVSIPAYRGRR